jgi:hypothetical protein
MPGNIRPQEQQEQGKAANPRFRRMPGNIRPQEQQEQGKAANPQVNG